LVDCRSDGAHPGLICHVAACGGPCRWQPLDPHWVSPSSSAIASS
jgi:hypothetical protein